MTRKLLPCVLSFVVCASAMALNTNLPKSNTRAEVKAYVERAAQYVAKNGVTCSALQSKTWSSGDYYLFVVDANDKLVCHPNASLVGTSADAIVDSKGAKVGTMLDMMARKGGGWVNYVWPRPGTTNPVPKSSYAMEVKAPDGKMYVIGAGGYEMK